MFMEPPTLDSPQRDRFRDDVDRALSDFFKSEMPNPWPALKLPEAEKSASPLPFRRPARSLLRSRLALAASILLMLLGSLFVASKFSAPPLDDSNGTPIASPPRPGQGIRGSTPMPGSPTP
jgi:hypothetical protein